MRSLGEITITLTLITHSVPEMLPRHRRLIFVMLIAETRLR
ncbi:hypothetical protein M495_01265 [Serratia liquefaciens ATCC 27592]|nr:hypothetical protein M495_01265 [Serratia liquefaciens ATCC 27592]